MTLPIVLKYLRQPVIAEREFEPVRMPTEVMPDEPEDSRSFRRPRAAFREWLTKQGLHAQPDSEQEDAEVFRGNFEMSKPLIVTVQFADGYAYMTVAQSDWRYPWEQDERATFDEPGARFNSKLEAWADRFYCMEQSIRRLADVEDQMWPYPKSMVSAPGVRYSPPAGQTSERTPLWYVGFFR